MASRIVLNTISYHGHGAIENIVPELTARGYKKAFVCSDPDLIKFGVTKKVTDLLDAAGFATAFTARSSPTPPSRTFRTALPPLRLPRLTASSPSAAAPPWIPPRPSASSSTTPSSRTSAAWRRCPHQEARRVHHCGAHHRRHRCRGHDQLRHHRCREEAQVRLRGHQRHPPRSPLSIPI